MGAKAHVGAHYLEHAAVDVLVRDAFDMTISDLFVPDFQRLGPEQFHELVQ